MSIHVCDGVVCWMNGYESVIDYLSKKLGIKPGENNGGWIIYPAAHCLYRLL